ncbi:MAG TPA: hypothetical protein VGI12_00285 [Vicinamibacterales bacterium]
MLYTHVELDAFFVAVERARRPDLAGRAVVIGGGPGSRGRVASASREARRRGIRAGMPLAQAAVLAPEAAFVDGAFDGYFAASLQVDAAIRRESADVEWLSVDAVAFTVGDDGLQAVEAVRRAIEALAFDASYGVARSKLVARIAAQLGRPRGMVHVLDGYEARFLSPLKIDLLPGIDPGAARRLRAAGIRRLGQVAKLSDAALRGLVGPGGAQLRRHAAGLDRGVIRRTALPPARIADRPLTPATADADAVRGALAAEIDRVGGDLRARGVLARTLTLRVRFADGRVDSRTAQLPEVSALDGVLDAAATALLLRLWDGTRLVQALGMSCGGLVASRRAPGLFAM